MNNESRTDEEELRDRLLWVTLLWVFTTDHLTRKRKLMRPSTDSLKYPHDHRPWFSWGTSTTLTSAEKTTQQGTHSRRFLQSIDSNILTEVVEEPTRRGVLLNFVTTNKEGPVEDLKIGGSLDCSDQVEFRILHGRSRETSRITNLDFRRANFGLLKDLLRGISWVWALAGRGVQESWLLLNHHFLHAQDRCIPMSKKSSKGGRGPA